MRAAVLGGARLALAQARGRVGRYRIVLRVARRLHRSASQLGPGQTTVERADRRPGPDHDRLHRGFELRRQRDLVPMLNRVGIPQISPASTAVGLTTAGPGASPGEPQKYYPTEIRTFARVVPSDAVQAGVAGEASAGGGMPAHVRGRRREVDGEDDGHEFPAHRASRRPRRHRRAVI